MFLLIEVQKIRRRLAGLAGFVAQQALNARFGEALLPAPHGGPTEADAFSNPLLSLITHADIPDIVWADDETGCYGVRGRDAKGKQIVVEQSGPIRIVSARK